MRESMVLLLRHDPTGVEFDVSFAWTAFEHEAIEASTDATYGSVVAPMARAEDLVVFKAMAARPVDIEDASALLLMHKDIDLTAARCCCGWLRALRRRGQRDKMNWARMGRLEGGWIPPVQ